jgi:hypothetical protein
VTFPEVDAAGWRKWFDDSVLNGNSGPGNEKSGTLDVATFGRCHGLHP